MITMRTSRLPLPSMVMIRATLLALLLIAFVSAPSALLAGAG